MKIIHRPCCLSAKQKKLKSPTVKPVVGGSGRGLTSVWAFSCTCNKINFSFYLHDARCQVSLFIVYAKVILGSTRANDLSGTHWWFWHQCSPLMVKVTNLPKTWFVHFYVLTLTLPVSLPLSLPGKARGVGVAQSHMGTSVWSLWSRPRHPAEPLVFFLCCRCPLGFLCLLSLSSHLVKGGRANTLLTRAPSDRWGRRGLRCHWLTAGESAMRIGGCRGTGMKTCVRRRWCWWRSCASTPREVTARANAARSSATCWEVATDSWTQVTDTPGDSEIWSLSNVW